MSPRSVGASISYFTLKITTTTTKQKPTLNDIKTYNINHEAAAMQQPSSAVIVSVHHFGGYSNHSIKGYHVTITHSESQVTRAQCVCSGTENSAIYKNDKLINLININRSSGAV